MKKIKGSVMVWVWVATGLGFVAVGVAGYLGWPRPFDPDTWWVPLMFCALGSLWVWRGLVPGHVRARKVMNVALFVIVSVLIVADVQWPF